MDGVPPQKRWAWTARGFIKTGFFCQQCCQAVASLIHIGRGPRWHGGCCYRGSGLDCSGLSFRSVSFIFLLFLDYVLLFLYYVLLFSTCKKDRKNKGEGRDRCFSKPPSVLDLREVSKRPTGERGREGGRGARRHVFVSMPVYSHLFPNPCFWFHMSTNHKQLLKAGGGVHKISAREIKIGP